MTKVSVFKNAKTTDKPFDADILVIYKSIRDGKYKKVVEQIREMGNNAIRKNLKEGLPSICFSGTFKTRDNSGLITHSGLVAQDFDHVSNYTEFWENITSDKHTYMAFRSPSGDGVKVIVKIPPSVVTHERSCIALKEYYSSPYLNYFKDVARICFISYDPEIYINENALLFDDLAEVTETDTPGINGADSIGDPDTIWKNITSWLENKKGQEYKDGNKYHFLVHLAAACCRFGLPKVYSVSQMWETYSQRASSVDKKDYIKIVDDVYKCYGSTFGTAIFKDQELVDKKTNEDISREITDFTLPNKDVILVADIQDSMLEGFRNGYQRGTTTYFPSIDEHWTWKRGEVTLMGGIGNHGKTTLMMQLCLVKSIKEGLRWAFFSPEQNPPNDFYDDLIHAYIGKSTQKQYPNVMSTTEYIRGMKFINEHFFYVFPKDDSPTPDYINSVFLDLIARYQVDGCIIDPFNMLENDWGRSGREDKYIGEFLSKEKRFAVKHDVYKIIIAHPKTLDKLTTGNYECPNIFDFSGGATWSAKVDNILQTYRPYFSTDPLNSETHFISQKIKKQKLVGKPGTTILSFDRAKSRYYSDGFNPIEHEKQTSIDGDDPF